MSQRYFMVYDSRAQYDFDDAEILQAYGEKKPSTTKLKRDHGGCGAVFAYCPVEGRGQLGSPVKIKVIE